MRSINFLLTYLLTYLLHPPHMFLQAGCPSCRPTNSVKALKATTWTTSAVSIFLSSSFFSSPNLSGRRLDVYHTSKHGVALVRI